MSDELLTQAEIEALLAGVNNPGEKEKAPTPGSNFDAEKVRNNIKKYFENNNNEMPDEESLNNLDQLRGLLGLKDEYTDEDIIAAEEIAQHEIYVIVASDDKVKESKKKLSAFIASSANKLSDEIMNSNKAKTDVLSGDDSAEADVADDIIPPVIEPKEESGQDASSDKNEAKEFLDSQTELIASGVAYIDSLVTQESAILPQFDKADVIYKLFGDKYIDKNQIRVLKNYYENYVLSKYLEDAGGKELPTAVRARTISLQLSDAQREAESYLDEKKEQLPTTVTGEPGEQDASPGKNEAEEFLDSQKDLVDSGKAYIDDLVADESAPIPPFNDSMFRSELFGDACTKQSQVKALENYYEKLLTEKEKQIEDGQSKAKGDRVRSIKSRLYDAANAVEDQINAGQERPLSEEELQKGIKENVTLYMRDQDADVLRDPDMLKACLLLREGFTDEDLRNHLGVLDELLNDPEFAEKATQIKEAMNDGASLLINKEEESSTQPQELGSDILEEKSEKETIIEVGTEFPDSDGNSWIVKEINGDFAIIEPLGLDESNTEPHEVTLRDLKERLKEIEAQRATAEIINTNLVDKYDAFRNNHNEIIDTRFEGNGGRVKKMFGGFFRNSSARVAIGMIIGVSSSLALGANPLASSIVPGVRMLTRNALSVFGFGTGNKARAIGNEQARAMKTLEFGLPADIERPGQEGFDEEAYNQALVENYKNITPEEQAKILATLVEISDQKGQKINTEEYKKQVKSIRETKAELAKKNGTLARFDEYREKFSKMSTKKKIAMSALIALVSIGGATAVGVATGGATLTTVGALAFFKSVGLASGTIGGMLTSGAIGMASGALMSNPEKTTDYSENSALVEALGKEYFAGGGEEKDLEQYYKEVNNRFNVALAKGVGVGLVFANAMTIFGLGKGALDHFKGHGANGGNEAVVGTTGKQVTSEPTGAGKSTQETVPGTGSTKPSIFGQTEPAPLSSGVKTPAEMPHELSKNGFDAKIASFGTNPHDLNAEKALAGGSLEGQDGHKFMDHMYKGLEGKHGLPAGAENHDQVVQQMTEKAKEMGVIDSHGNLTDKVDASKFDPQEFTRAVTQHDDNYLHTLNHDLNAYEQTHASTNLSAEAAVMGARHSIEPAVHTDVDKHVVGATHARPEVSTAEHIDKEVASKINQANIDPAGKSFEKATTLSMNQVNKIIDPNSGNKYMDGWFGSFLRRGVEHGYLKEGDLRVMIDQAGHPQMKVNLSHFPSQESTGIASNHLGIGLKGIPENAGIDSVYKDRPWWDLRSNFVKVNTENVLSNKVAHGTGTPMPTPEGHQKVDITPEIKQNSTDGVIRFKAEDVDPTTKTDFPNSSAGHTAPEHGTIPETKTNAGTAVPESVITNKIEPAHFDTSYWKSPEGLSQLNGNAEIKDAGILNIKGPIFDPNGKLQDADFTFRTDVIPQDLAEVTKGMTDDQIKEALHSYYLNTIRDQIETR